MLKIYSSIRKGMLYVSAYPQAIFDRNERRSGYL
jgi:hypothetical protein